MSHTSAPSADRGFGPSYDRSIVEAVGDPARPRANLQLNRDLAHLPGESGLLAGAVNIFQVMRTGAHALTAQVRSYGPVYRHMLGPEPGVFVADPDLHAAIARNEDKIWSASLAYRSLFAGLVPGVQALDFVSTFDFELHRDVRKSLQHAFNPGALAGYFDIAVHTYQPAIDAWVRRGKISFKREVRRLFADLAGRIFMGIGDPREAKQLDKATADVWRSLTVLIQHPLLSPTWRSALRGYRTLHEGLSRQVENRRVAGGKDLFSRLCQARPEILDDEGLVRLLVGIMLAAFDTTSSGLASMGYLLAQHPEWQERLRGEAQSFAGSELSYDELRQLEAHDWAWKESLRLYPVVMGFPRIALRDTELGGHRIPARTLVTSLVAPVLRDERYWTDPERFDPERFSPDRAEDARRGVYMPFGTGAHVCLGMPLSNFEAKLFWRMLLSKARIRLARDYEGRHQIRPIGGVSGSVDLVLEPL